MPGVYNFVINLADQVSPEAKKAQAAIDELSDKIRGNRDAVLGMNKAIRSGADAMRSCENPTKELLFLNRNWMGQARDMKAELLAQNQRLYMNRAAIEDQAKASILSAHGIKSMGEAIEAVAKGDAASAVDAVSKSLGGMAEGMSAGAMAGALLAGAAVVAGAALAGLAFEGAKLAIEATEAKEAMTSLFDAMGEGKSTGDQVIEMFDEMRGRLGMTRAQLSPMAADFEAMGMHSVPELRVALTAAASSAAMMGEKGSSAFVNMMGRIEQAEEAAGGLLKMNVGRKNPFAAMGVDINDISRAMGITSKQLAGMLKNGTADAQSFGNALEMAITQKGDKRMNQLAGSFGVTEKRMREGFSEMFENVQTGPFLESFRAFGELFDKDTVSGKMFGEAVTGSLNSVMDTAKWSLIAVKDGIDFLEIYYLQWQVWIYDVENAFLDLMSLIPRASKAAYDAMPDWGKAGADTASGFVMGMMGLKPSVEQAGIDLGKAAHTGLATELDVHSPSKKTEEIGKYAAQGFEQGYSNEASSANMAAPILAHYGDGGGGGSNHIDVRAEFHFTGSGSAGAAAELTEEAVSLIFERVALAQGLG